MTKNLFPDTTAQIAEITGRQSEAAARTAAAGLETAHKLAGHQADAVKRQHAAALKAGEKQAGERGVNDAVAAPSEMRRDAVDGFFDDIARFQETLFTGSRAMLDTLASAQPAAAGKAKKA